MLCARQQVRAREWMIRQIALSGRIRAHQRSGLHPVLVGGIKFQGQWACIGPLAYPVAPLTLQSEAGYIDARPHNRQLDENLLRRTAGPYKWVNCRRRASWPAAT